MAGRGLAAGCVLLAVGTVLVRHVQRSDTAVEANVVLPASSPTPEALSFRISNAYTRDQEVIGSGAYPWKYLAEPHRETTIQPMFAAETSKKSFAVERATWTVTEPAASAATVKSFSKVQRSPGAFITTFQKAGLHQVHLALEMHGSTLRSTFSEEVMVKWVRREIRSLVDSDRERFLQALSLLYTLDMAEGQQQYGPNYRDIHYMVRNHLNGAAARECDHWHDGAGIMAHHMGFTLEMEQALQSVDPSVAVPYWDYTLDSYLYGANWSTSSPVFDPEWFGAANPSHADHVVTEGRWAYSGCMTNAGDFSDITNAWGLLRSPWNTNPTPYLTRSSLVLQGQDYTEFPGCSMFYFAFLSTSLAQLQNYLNGGTHGPVHIMIGGQWANNWAPTLQKYLSPRMGDVLLLSKWLWRSGYIRCPTDCTSNPEDTPGASCTCSCSSDILTTGDTYEVLKRTSVLHWLADDMSDIFFFNGTDSRWHMKDKSPVEEEEVWSSLLAGLCEVGWPGDMFTSAAPYDPTFWLVHPTSDRLLSWLRILNHRQEITFDETYGYDHQLSAASNTTPPSDTGYVCDWETGDGVMPECRRANCPGHAPDDLLPFPNFINGTGQGLSNLEMYQFMAPHNPALPYVYDSFEWPHCTAQGYNFTAASHNATLSMPPAP